MKRLLSIILTLVPLICLSYPTQTKADDEKLPEPIIKFSPARPYDDQARVLNTNTRQLILDLNQAYTKTSQKVTFYVATLADGDENEDIDDLSERVMTALTTAQGNDQTYILIVYDGIASQMNQGPAEKVAVSTNHENAPIVQGLDDTYMADLFDQHRSDLSYYPEKALPDLLKQLAKRINETNHFQMTEPSLKVQPEKPKPKIKPVDYGVIQSRSFLENFVNQLMMIGIFFVEAGLLFSPCIFAVYVLFRPKKTGGAVHEK